ncbi:hypothetical protein [Clostridium saccharobutylicum]|uniref:hypothetical protein n=1 Tax=Clostridium saccharobutylicum TaxID=169679 RepID=UPI00098BF06E|nr:hypothetical protein [Clostridium saccharobutylicum]
MSKYWLTAFLTHLFLAPAFRALDIPLIAQVFKPDVLISEFGLVGIATMGPSVSIVALFLLSLISFELSIVVRVSLTAAFAAIDGTSPTVKHNDNAKAISLFFFHLIISP